MIGRADKTVYEIEKFTNSKFILGTFHFFSFFFLADETVEQTMELPQKIKIESTEADQQSSLAGENAQESQGQVETISINHSKQTTTGIPSNDDNDHLKQRPNRKRNTKKSRTSRKKKANVTRKPLHPTFTRKKINNSIYRQNCR